MDQTGKKILNRKLVFPFIVALIGVIVVIAGLFLPYMNAQGKLAQYIELLDSAGFEEENISPAPTLISLKGMVTTIYGEVDGKLVETIELVFGGFLALIALFVFLRKPIAIMIFDLLALGSFTFLNVLMAAVLIAPDKFGWGMGCYVIALAIALIFAAAVWMLIKKILAKRQLQAAPMDPAVAEAPAE